MGVAAWLDQRSGKDRDLLAKLSIAATTAQAAQGRGRSGRAHPPTHPSNFPSDTRMRMPLEGRGRRRCCARAAACCRRRQDLACVRKTV